MGAPKITVKIDPDLQDIVPGYLEKRKNEISILQAAVDNADYQKLEVMGHKIKGSGGGYGFADLGAMGAALEQAAKAKNVAKVGLIVKEIKEYLDKIEVIY